MADLASQFERGEPGYAITVRKVGAIPNQHWTVVHGLMEVRGCAWTRKGALIQARRAAAKWHRDSKGEAYTEHWGPTVWPPIPVAADAPFTDFDG